MRDQFGKLSLNSKAIEEVMIPAAMPGCCVLLEEEEQDLKERTMSLGAQPSLVAKEPRALLC